jgi:hypothetical protein
MASLILNRGSTSRSSGQWRDDDYDVLHHSVVVAAFPCQARAALSAGSFCFATSCGFS